MELCEFRTAALRTTAWHRCQRNTVRSVLVFYPPALQCITLPAPPTAASATNSGRCAGTDVGVVEAAVEAFRVLCWHVGCDWV